MPVLRLKYLGSQKQRNKERKQERKKADQLCARQHLCALSIQRDGVRAHPLLRAWRLTSLFCLLVMLCVAVFPASSYLWPNFVLDKTTACRLPDACPLLQADEALRHNWLLPQGVMGYLVVVSSYAWQVAMTFPKIHAFLVRWPRARLLRGLEARSICRKRGTCTQLHRWHHLRRASFLGLYFFTLGILELIGSYAFSLYLMLLSLAWATFQLVVTRYASLPACVRHALGQWTFEQILPLLLLFGPFYTVIAHIFRYISSPRPETPSELPSRRTVHRATSVEADPPNPRGVLSTRELFAHITEHSHAVTATAEEEAEARRCLHDHLYSLAEFRLVLYLMGFGVLAATGGYFAQTSVAYLDRDFTQPSAVYSQVWTSAYNALPTLVGAAVSFLLVFLLCLALPVLSARLGT